MDHQDPSNLREEVQKLLPRAVALVAVGPSAAPPSAPDLDRMIEEASELEARAGTCLADDDASLGTLRVALGTLYAFRGNRFGWTDAHRAQALRCFRAARAGGHLTAVANLEAMLLFVVMLVPAKVADFGPDVTGKLGSMLALIREMQESGPIIADLHELRELIEEIVAAHPDDPRAAKLKAFSVTLNIWLRLMRDPSNVTTAEMRGHVEDLPVQPTGQIGALLGELMKQAENLERRQDPEVPSLPAAAETALAADQALPWDDLTILIEMCVPGALDRAEFQTLISSYEAEGTSRSLGIAAFGRLAMAVRTNDPQEVDRALRNLREVMNSPDAGEMAWLLTSVYPSLLSWSASSHGNRQDEAKALGLFQGDGLQTPDPELDEIGLVSGNLGQSLRISQAIEAEDESALAGLIAEFAQAGPTPDAFAEWQFLQPMQQALAKLALAVRRHDGDMAREAYAHLQVAREKPMPEAVRPLMESLASSAHMIVGALENQPVEVGKAVESARDLLMTDLGPYDGAVQTRMLLASGLMAQYLLLSDGPARAKFLGEAIDALEQAKDLLTERTGTQTASRVLWSLAEALRSRRDAARRDNRRAVALTRESLELVAGDVLLQLGAEHGLQTARTGALRGLRAAGWALEEYRVEDAIRVLELGRGLVLRATATAGTVPDRLRAVHEVELAEQWERSSAGSGKDAGRVGEVGGNGEAVSDAAVPGADAAQFNLPSDLRRRALEALRAPRTAASDAASGPGSDSQPQRDLLVVPTLAQIVGHLDRAGLDALVYLLPGTDDTAGKVLMVLRDGATRELPLTSLGKVDDYLDQSARRYQRLRSQERQERQERQEPTRDLEPETRWELSLDELCAWAGTAVMNRVIAALPFVPTPEAPGRVVLIPCGRLGLVPWHAALVAPRPSTAGLSRPPRACDVLVVSYAASADELVRSLSRRRTPYATDPVLVVDPSRTLRYAEEEAVTLRRTYLPAARLMGSVKGQEVEAAGTPEQVQAALTGDGGREPASMVQIIAHGTASSRPTASRLLLARPDGAEEESEDDGGPEYLTVAEIVDASRPGSRDRFSSLVILDCCETDLSSRDHDEALTLTTAFVARGATDVIGSRWAVDDWATAVCMVVFHHYLAGGGRTPAEALRAAQRWMLDADREPIPAVSEHLLQEMQTPLDDVSKWAPFIHQGNAGLS
ncbi:hypothetical protein ABH920_001674 [Catenulispora sp. EB89]|uniref:CHAT domain-containing protein n=1 Tax=Catenulispora sp. EB89 TaxID=3156257 RepID=UPI00351837D1